MFPSLSVFTKESCTPFSSISYRGRSTELCSNIVVITLSPFLNIPFIAIFKASVELQVKAILLESFILKNLARFSLVSKTV